MRQLQAAVRRVKAGREWEARFMIFEEMMQEQREAGRAEGKAEDILDLLDDLPGETSEELKSYLFSVKDCEVLRRYLRLAASATFVENFMQSISCTRQS